MEQAEIEPLVSELETRVDRLRSLYDQYFMGIERLEPLVPRKDVERRLAMLRKEQIRNTGVRFRFQMIIQRFNTYVTHWQRITRQIETGTFKRHVMRATARFGVDPTKERSVEPAAAEGAKRAGPAASPDADGSEEVYELDLLPDDDSPPGLEDDPFGGLIPVLDDEEPAPVPKERFASAVSFELDEIATPFEEHDPFPKPAQKKASPPQVRVSMRAPDAPASATSLDTERRVPVAPPSRPMISKRPPPKETEARTSDGAPPLPAPMQVSVAVARPVAPTAAPGPFTLPVSVPPRAPIPIGGSFAPRPPMQTLSGMPPPRVAPVAPVAPASVPRMPAASPGTPRSLPPTPPLTRAFLADAANAAPIPQNTPPPRAPLPTTAPGPTIPRPATPPAARPAPSVSKAPPAARPASPTVKPAVAPPARVGDLSGDRFGEIYSKYVETRRQHNEPTHAITRDALAKQLSESTERLRQKVGAKAIDFEVVVKDGRTILRPVVK